MQQLTRLEEYQQLLNWLKWPHYSSAEEGRAAVSLSEEQPYTFFIVQTKGNYEVHRAYLQRGAVASQVDMTILFLQLDIAKERAIRELGEAALDNLKKYPIIP